MACSKDEFSCADGGCVSWALTCNGEKDCEDGTDEPLFCKKQGGPSIWEITTTTATKNKQNTHQQNECTNFMRFLLVRRFLLMRRWYDGELLSLKYSWIASAAFSDV